ncbi:TPA: hypothetical protein PC496_000787 [Clostridioides difficile]|nr:hypothetical protein [Clostridioides difficile]
MPSIKKRYKIPHTINVVEGLDTPIALKFGALGIAVPVPLNLFLLNIVVIMIGFSGVAYMVKNNFGIIPPILFVIAFIPLARMLLKKTKTGERGYKWVIPTLIYYPMYKSRMIVTRSTAEEEEVEDLKNVIGVEEIDPKTGITKYTNGDTAVAIRVIGNGSNSLFDNEVEQIILAYEQFLRELDYGVHPIVSMKEGNQNCSSQIEALEKQKFNSTNPTVQMILNKRINTLKGIENNFKTTEYTLFLRSDDPKKIETSIKTLRQTNSGILFKYFETIYGEDVFEEYKSFFTLS